MADSASAAGPIVKLEDVQVTGSRLQLNAGERPAQPVLTYTSQDLERAGLSSLGQLFQYIPSITSSSTGLAIESSTGVITSGTASSTAARTTAQLRGGAESATLLLVDGKRVARTGQQNAGGVGFDLGGIPLTAIERVEVLLDGASAIYGSDAINGVINVILKKRYAGTELRLTYDNTFDKDAGYRTASLTHGFAKGKWSGLLTLSASDNNLMLLRDRRLTSTYNRTLLGGTINNAGTLYIEGNGTLMATSGTLPGLSTAVVSIPDNATGQTLPVSAFANTPVPAIGTGVLQRGAMTYANDESAYARLGYEFNELLQFTAMARVGEHRTIDNGQFRRAAILLPVGYPGNPFSVPVRLTKLFYELPLVYTRARTTNKEFSLSANGKLFADWRYEASVNYVRGTNFSPPTYLSNGHAAVTTLSQTVFNAAVAAGRQPLLVYDSHTQSPHAPDALDEFFVQTPGNIFVYSDLAQTWTYSAQAGGKVLTLPAGDLRAVVGAEYREEYVAFPGAVGTEAWPATPERKVTAAFAEVRVPVVASKHGWPLVRQLDLNVAARSEGYSDVKGGQVITPRYGVAWRPLSTLLVRGSYGEGFLVPNLYDTAPRQRTLSSTWSSGSLPIDSLRGNQNLTGQTYTSFIGGNPDLRPQRSENWAYGAVWEVPKVKGLSLSFDYFDNNYIDRFGSVSLLMDRINYAPETVLRGPNLPGDPGGWAGPITGIISKTVNIAAARVGGYNFGVRWNRSTPWGDLTLSSSGERILHIVQQVTPNAIPTASVNKKFNPMRVTTALFWSRGPWDAGVTNIYGGRYWVTSTNEALVPSRWTDDVMRFDVNTSYDFGRSRGFGLKGSAWWQRALHDTKLSVTIINVANTEPPLDLRGFFSTSVIDARLRRYVIDLTKRF